MVCKVAEVTMFSGYTKPRLLLSSWSWASSTASESSGESQILNSLGRLVMKPVRTFAPFSYSMSESLMM